MPSMYSLNLRKRILAGEFPGWIQRHSRREYIVRIILSTPDWVDRRAVIALRREAARKSQSLGHRYVVDHIVPVTHPHVCGLTVPWNLRIILEKENAARSNRWWEWTEDLFSLPEQLKLL